MNSEQRQALHCISAWLERLIAEDCHDPYAAEPPDTATLEKLRLNHPLRQIIEALHTLNSLS